MGDVMGMCCWMGSHFYDWIDYENNTNSGDKHCIPTHFYKT